MGNRYSHSIHLPDMSVTDQLYHKNRKPRTSVITCGRRNPIFDREPSRACDPHRFPCTQRLLTTDKLPLQGRTGRQSNRGLRNERHGKFPISRRQCHVGMCELTSSAGPRRCSTYRRTHGRKHARPPHTRAVAHVYPTAHISAKFIGDPKT